ncbi:hypothetical protein QG37_04408 [Candidozyma auris]|uniref:Uncharacterized protein n=1 Tax=Candidozyma auris TaxID=498019 RepID=A0A0L0NWI5_CANAR|nr:hypothetical protein QG37_04408 [[Candida] auris]
MLMAGNGAPVMEAWGVGVLLATWDEEGVVMSFEFLLIEYLAD